MEADSDSVGRARHELKSATKESGKVTADLSGARLPDLSKGKELSGVSHMERILMAKYVQRNAHWTQNMQNQHIGAARERDQLSIIAA